MASESNTELLMRSRDFWNGAPCELWHGDNLSDNAIEQHNIKRTWRYTVQPHIPQVLRNVCSYGDNVLEFGCGIATDGAEIASTVPNYIGYDISEKSLTQARQRFHKLNIKGKLLEDTIETQDLVKSVQKVYTGKFNCIYSFGVLHHLPEDTMDKVLQQFRELIHPEGKLIIMVYAKNSWKYAMIKEGLDQFEAEANCPIARVYTIEEITETLANAGFKVTKSYQTHIFQYNIPHYRNGELKKKEFFEKMPKPVLDALENQLGWHLIVEASPV